MVHLELINKRRRKELMNMKDKIREVTILSYLDNNMVNICVEDVYKIHHVMTRKFYTSSLGQYVKIAGKRVYITNVKKTNIQNRFNQIDHLVKEYKIALNNNDEEKIKRNKNLFKELGLELVGLYLMSLVD